MKKKVFVLVYFGLIAIFAIGCGARVEIVKDKLLSQIGGLLGKIDVERKQIDIAMK